MIAGLVAASGAIAWFVRSDLDRERAFRTRLDAALPTGDLDAVARPAPGPTDATRLRVTMRDGATPDHVTVDVGGVVVDVPRAPGDPQDAALVRLAEVLRAATARQPWGGASLAVEARDALTFTLRLVDALATAGLGDLEMRSTLGLPPR
jgi:hypothetical protein